MSTEQLTDEQIGRRWCERNGKRPHLLPFDPLWWSSVKGMFDLPESSHLLHLLMTDQAVRGCWKSEATAFAVIGAALRQLWEFAESSRKDVLS